MEIMGCVGEGIGVGESGVAVAVEGCADGGTGTATLVAGMLTGKVLPTGCDRFVTLVCGTADEDAANVGFTVGTAVVVADATPGGGDWGAL